MGIKAKELGGWCTVSLLLLVANLAAASSDLRLAEAVEKRDQKAVRSLLGQHVDVNTPQADGATALMWASHWDDMGTVDLLIGAGANVNASNDYGVTALSLACTNGNVAMVEKLLQAGADPNAALQSGETPLMTAAWTGNADVVKSLLARGAATNAKENRGGQTALMWAVAQKHAEVVRALIAYGADVHARSDRGFTPLLFAAQQGDLDLTRILLTAGANVNESTPEDGSALVVASASGHEAIAIFLVEKGADPNATDANGITALHYTVRKGLAPASGIEYNKSYRLPPPHMSELAKALLAHGANPNARILKDYPVHSLSPLPSRMSMASATPFLLAAAAGDASSIMRILAANGADPRLAAKGNLTPLMAAAGIVRGFYEGLTEEEERHALESVRLALELGADINAANNDGRTALHGAAYIGANSIIQLLAERGANLDVKDKYGLTPWDITEGVLPDMTDSDERFDADGRVFHKSAASLLLKLGARPRNTPGLNPQN